jgi:hypothetical protein
MQTPYLFKRCDASFFSALPLAALNFALSSFMVVTFIVVTREDVSSSLLYPHHFYVHTRFQEATVE